jgi:hypothetical protein
MMKSFDDFVLPLPALVQQASEYVMFRDLGQDDDACSYRDEIISDYGEDAFFRDCKKVYRDFAYLALTVLLTEERPLTFNEFKAVYKRLDKETKQRRRGCPAAG